MSTADQFLLDQWILKRDARAFKSLTSHYCGMVYGTCVRILRNTSDAEDVTQECFMALAAVARGPRESMGAWLHGVATHKALNHRRSDQRRRSREEHFASSKAVSAQPQWDDVSRFVDEAIEALPAKLRSSIVSHFMEDQSVTAIAAQEGVTHSAISQRLQKGVFLIRERLKQRGISITASVLATMVAGQAFAAPVVSAGLSQTLGKIALSGSSAAAPHVSTTAVFGMKGVAAISIVALALTSALVLVSRSESKAVSAAGFDDETQSVPGAALEDSALVTAAVEPEARPTEVSLATAAQKPIVMAAAVDEEPLASTAIDDWRDVVKAYKTHQDRIRSITFDYEDTMKGDYFHRSYSDQPGYREASQRGTVSTDGVRCYMEQYRWGNWFGGEIMAEEHPDIHACVWNGSDSFEYHGGGGSFYGVPGSLQLWLDAQNTMIRDSAFSRGRIYTLYNRYPGGPMLGYPVPTGRRLEEFLDSTPNIALRYETESVGGADCYVVDAETDFGTFAVWFDPSHDFNVAKFTLSKRPGHYIEDRIMNEGVTHDYAYDVQRFAKIDGLWVPKEAIYRKRVVGQGGEGFDYTSHHKRTSIKLNADSDDDSTYALHADYIPNGSRWMNTDNPNDQTEYVWRNGEVVPKTDSNSYRPTPAQKRASSLVAGGFGAGRVGKE